LQGFEQLAGAELRHRRRQKDRGIRNGAAL
jgi:hypothetical protein